MDKPNVYILVGQTAIGKTDVSIYLAKLMNAEIISADSIQLYKTLDIGSAKPTLKERNEVHHHMVDVLNLNESNFSVSAYKDMALKCIDTILKKNKNVLVVGGSGLYVQALCSTLNFANIPACPSIRDKLNKKESENPGYLYKKLEEVDIITASKLHPNDTKRIVRALEVYEVSNKPISLAATQTRAAAYNGLPYRPVLAGLAMDRDKLYQRIEKRVDNMLDMGLLEEVKMIYDKGYDRKLNALQSLGYKQLLMYYNNEITLIEAIELIKKETRHFAKRQWTWFKRDERIRWFDVTNETNPQITAGKIYDYFTDYN